MGELADAVRAHGMRFGLYYSGGYDWTFNDHPIGSLADGLMAIPRDKNAQADSTTRRRHRRNDRLLPKTANDLFEYYFERVADGAVNDRWMAGPCILRIKPLRGAI